MKRASSSVVFLIRNVASDDFGGGEIYQIALAEELEAAGFRPIVLTNSEKLIERAKHNNVEVIRPPRMSNQNWSGWRNVLLPIYFIYQRFLENWYGRLFSEYRPSVVNIQSRDEMIAATKAARKKKIKVIWTDHADFLNWTLNNVNVRFKNAIGKKIIELSKLASAVIFVSEELKKQTERMIAPLKIMNSVVIENGVKDKYTSKMANDKSIIYIGRVVKEKGVGELIDAFKDIARDNPKASLSIYGDGDIEKYKKNALDCKNIVFCGYTDDPDAALARGEIFVLPSYMEGMSLALLDAAMMGKKIIATDVGGNSEVVIDGKTGLLVPSKNPKKLAKAMEYMLQNKRESEQMASAVRRLYEKKYNLDKIFAEKMLPLYNNIKENTK